MRSLSVIFFLVFIVGCAAQPRQFPAPPQPVYEQVSVEGYRNIRFWGDEPAPYLDEVIQKLKAADVTMPHLDDSVDILALSGGAEDGAYGAGFLKGWTETGERPEFLMVTGVSTGAIIAPLAFLGPEYDDALRGFYTQTSSDDVYYLTPFAALFGGEALADTEPLRAVIEAVVDAELVAAIAAESRRGRILQIATTNLDAQRPVIWEIGAIAESGLPGSIELIRKIILASASIPGVFPPVKIDVVHDGVRYQELHVDGGVTQQIFVYPRDLDISRFRREMGTSRQRNFWLIRNTKQSPDYREVELGVGDISSRAMSTLLKYQGKGNLVNIAFIAERDEFDVNITDVPADFDVPLEDFFDETYMRALYEVGYQQGRNGGWRKGL